MWNMLKEAAYIISVGAFGALMVLYCIGEIPFDKAMHWLIVSLFCCLIFKE